MTKLFAKFSLTVFVISALCIPLTSHAAGLLGFGGLVDYSYPCTCSAAEWGYFTPLFLNSSKSITGPLVYDPYATVPFSYYLPTVPHTYNLGEYVPGVQACWEYAGYFCYPLPNYGVMAYVGTSK